MTATTEEIVRHLNEPTSLLLAWLYERYAKSWYGLATSRWRIDADSAWEIVYKTLDTLLAKRSSLPTDPPAHFDNYLFKIFTNNLRQHLRQRARQNESFRLVQLTEGPSGQTSNELVRMDELAVSDDTFAQLFADDETYPPLLTKMEQALAQLPEMDRSLLLLKAQEFSYDEIAGMLGIENKQLKVRHFRAKQKLIQLINEIQL